MNRNQKITIAIGVILIILSGLFPPYEGELTIQGDSPRRHLGRHFIFAPPTPEYVNRVMEPSNYNLLLYRSEIVLSEIGVQLSVIILATVGMVFLLTKKEG